MDPFAPGYMHWAKLHPPARFELTQSGLKTASLADIHDAPTNQNLEPGGPYGEPGLIAAIAGFRAVPVDRVLPVPGASTANFVALACAARPGDRVLIETPGYDPLARAAALLGLNVIPFARVAARRYAPDLAAVERGLQDGARAVIITNLHNPSGLLCPESALRQLARLTAQHSATLIVDEVYLDYARLNVGLDPLRAHALGDHVITTDSLTKVYGLGPLRAGWLIADPAVLERARHVVDLIHVVNPVVSARLARSAFARLPSLAQRGRQTHESTLAVFNAWLESRPDVGVHGHDGALFVWLKLPENVSAARLAKVLAADFETHVVPGTFFGCDAHVRISLAVAAGELHEGLKRVGAAIDRIRTCRDHPEPRASQTIETP